MSDAVVDRPISGKAPSNLSVGDEDANELKVMPRYSTSCSNDRALSPAAGAVTGIEVPGQNSGRNWFPTREKSKLG
jgi:hypothetical protein